MNSRPAPKFSYKDEEELQQQDNLNNQTIPGQSRNNKDQFNQSDLLKAEGGPSKILSEDSVRKALNDSVEIVVDSLETLMAKQDLQKYAEEQQYSTPLPKISTPRSRSPTSNAMVVELFNKTHTQAQPLVGKREELEARKMKDYLGKRMDASSPVAKVDELSNQQSRPLTPKKSDAGDRTPARSIASSGRQTPTALSRGSSKGRSPSALAGAGLIDEAAKKAALRRQTILMMHKFKQDSRGNSVTSNEHSGITSRNSSGAVTPSNLEPITPRSERVDEDGYQSNQVDHQLFEDDDLDQGDLVLPARVRIQPAPTPRPSAIFVPANKSTAAMAQAIINQGVAPMGPLGQFAVQMKLRESGGALQEVYCPVPMAPQYISKPQTPNRFNRDTVSESSSASGEENFSRVIKEILIPERSFEAGNYLQALSSGSYSSNSLHLMRPSLDPLLGAILSFPAFRSSSHVSSVIPKWASGITQLLLLDLPSAYIILNESFVSSGEYADHWKVMLIRNAIKRIAVRIAGLDRESTTALNKFRVYLKHKADAAHIFGQEVKRKAAEYSAKLVPEYLDHETAVSERFSTYNSSLAPPSPQRESAGEKKGLTVFDFELPRGTKLEDGHLVLVYDCLSTHNKQEQTKEARGINWISEDGRFCVVGVITTDVYGKPQLNIAEKFEKAFDKLIASKTAVKFKLVGNISYRMRQFLNLQKLDLEPLSQLIYKPTNLDQSSSVDMRKQLHPGVQSSLEGIGKLFRLDQDQRRALRSSLGLRRGIQLITGAPGTGKTKVTALLLLLAVLQSKKESLSGPILVVSSSFVHLIVLLTELNSAIGVITSVSLDPATRAILRELKELVAGLNTAVLVNNLPGEFMNYMLIGKPQKRNVGLLGTFDIVIVLPNSHKVNVQYEMDGPQDKEKDGRLPGTPASGLDTGLDSVDAQSQQSSIFLSKDSVSRQYESLVLEVLVSDLLQEIGVIETCIVEDAHRLREDTLIAEIVGYRIERLILVGDERGIAFGTGGMHLDPNANFCCLAEDDLGGQYSPKGLSVLQPTQKIPLQSEQGVWLTKQRDKYLLEEEELSSLYNRSLLERILKSRGILYDRPFSAGIDKLAFVRLTYQHRMPPEIAAFVKKEFYGGLGNDLGLEEQKGWTGQSKIEKFGGHTQNIFKNHLYFFDFDTTHKTFGSTQESKVYFRDGTESMMGEESRLGSPEGSRAPSVSDMESVKASSTADSKAPTHRVIKSKPSGTYANGEEASLVVSLVELLKLKLGDEEPEIPVHLKSKIAIIAGFEGQKLLLERVLADRNISGVKVGLPVEFECSEIQIAIISLTKSSEVEADPVVSGLKDSQVLANILGRVTHGLYVVGRLAAWKNSPVWMKLIQHFDNLLRCKKVQGVDALERELHYCMTAQIPLPCAKVFSAVAQAASSRSLKVDHAPLKKAESKPTHGVYSQSALKAMMLARQMRVAPQKEVELPKPTFKMSSSGKRTVRDMLLQRTAQEMQEARNRGGLFNIEQFN